MAVATTQFCHLKSFCSSILKNLISFLVEVRGIEPSGLNFNPSLSQLELSRLKFKASSYHTRTHSLPLSLSLSLSQETIKRLRHERKSKDQMASLLHRPSGRFQTRSWLTWIENNRTLGNFSSRWKKPGFQMLSLNFPQAFLPP